MSDPIEPAELRHACRHSQTFIGGVELLSCRLCRAAATIEALTAQLANAEAYARESAASRSRLILRVQDLEAERDEQIARVLRHQATIEDQNRDILQLMAERDALAAAIDFALHEDNDWIDVRRVLRATKEKK